MTPAEIIAQVLERYNATREEVFRPGNIPHEHRAARYDVVRALHRIGLRTMRIAKLLRVTRHTVRKIVNHLGKWTFTVVDPGPVDAGLRCMPDLRAKIVAILNKYRTTWRVVVGYQRNHKLSAPRFEIYCLLRSRGWSFPRIGRFCNRDHSSIVHRIKTDTAKLAAMKVAA